MRKGIKENVEPGATRKFKKKGNMYILGETRGKIKWIFFKIS